MKEINIRLPFAEPKTSDIYMSGKNKNGDEVGVNREHFIKDGKPWFPVAGEFHFSRYPSEYWKEALQKVKAGGLDTVATYVFWIHHEEIEGRFKWDGCFDLKKFIELCGEVGLSVILRIGPWDHGEVRNGGYPDWLFEKTQAPGTNDPQYFKYSRRLYTEIFKQVSTFLYKDNGPIIGIQIDNEYGHCHGLKGDEGRKHMMLLKNIALEVGFDVPMYTATGWGGAMVVEDEFVPLMAAYVEGSWEQHVDKATPNINYVFTSVRDDQSVGSDLMENEAYACTYDIGNYPYATCELGGGMQASYQRRPIITKEDTEAMAFVKLGSGASMLGYYMYQGGTNPIGQLTTFQETRATGFPNDLPKLTYDYQAPLGEYGQSNPSYHALRRLHYFSKDQQAILTRSKCVIPNDKEIKPADPSTLRYSVRYLGSEGFVFINNYQHNLVMDDQENLQFTLEVENEVIKFPTVHLKSGEWRLLPFNLNLDGVRLKCATMQPLTSLTIDGDAYYFYYGGASQEIEYRFDPLTVKSVVSGNSQISQDGRLVVGQSFLKTQAILEPIVLEKHNGSKVHIITLTKDQASQLNRVEIDGSVHVLLSDADTYVDGQQIQVSSIGTAECRLLAFPPLAASQKISGFITESSESIFKTYHVKWETVKPNVLLKRICKTTDGRLKYEIQAEEGFLKGCADVFLNIDFEGDIAQLTCDGELKADWFYNGLTWKIGLKRFAQQLPTGRWILDISPLKEDAYVYLDKWPQMEDGKALRIVDYKVVPEYRIF